MTDDGNKKIWLAIAWLVAFGQAGALAADKLVYPYCPEPPCCRSLKNGCWCPDDYGSNLLP
jgi:hypothetical protein